MNQAVKEILDHNWIPLDISFDKFDDLKKTVPRKPGLYSILTNTPKGTLRLFGKRNDKKHYNLMKKVDD